MNTKTREDDDDHSSAIDDKISKMPRSILDNILGRLTVKEAVKTSFLSKQWRNKWVHLSKLIFDDTSVDVGCDKIHATYLVNFVYYVLLSHRGNIHTFNFSTSHRPDFSEFDHWIQFLSKNGIKELGLEFGISSYNTTDYVTPPCLFSCQQLTHLKLTDTSLAPPDTFQGFRNLVSLHLRNYINNTEVLADFIRKCPVLESLVLKYFHNLVCFKIDAPKLKHLCLEGSLGTVVLENCPVLSDITFRTTSDFFSSVKYREQKVTRHLVHYLGALFGLMRLKLSGYFLKHLLHKWDESETHSTACSHLKVLELNKLHLDDLSETKAALAILKLFPNLQELHITCDDAEVPAQSLQFPDQSSCCFELLQVVNIHIFCTHPSCVNSGGHKLNLIKFLLTCSPALERMTIINDNNIIRNGTYHTVNMRELLLCKASADLQITYSARFP